METKKLEIKKDERGELFEVFKFSNTGQIFYSSTEPGAVRGNHYHTRKKEVFCLIEGEAKIRQRNRETNEIEEKIVSGNTPELVEMKLNWTHNIQNIGNKKMKLLVWVNEIFNPSNSDTFPDII